MIEFGKVRFTIEHHARSMAACPSFALSSTVVRRVVGPPPPISVAAHAAQLSLLGNSTMLMPSYSPKAKKN